MAVLKVYLFSYSVLLANNFWVSVLECRVSLQIEERVVTRTNMHCQEKFQITLIGI